MTGYLWAVARGDGLWMAVLPPSAEVHSILWGDWVRRQDAKKRRRVEIKGKPSPYWLLHPSLRLAVLDRFVSAGWPLAEEEPPASLLFKLLEQKQESSSSQEEKGRPRQSELSQCVASAYRTLFLRPDAPKSVVVAAHRALSKESHPDMGGDTAQAAAVNAAKDLIFERRGW